MIAEIKSRNSRNHRWLAAVVLGLLGVIHVASPVRAHDRDDRDHPNQYYPARGRVVAFMPRGAVIVRGGSGRYYYHGGVWYRPYGFRYQVVLAPFGFYVPVLPPFYTTIWVRGIPYYYADDAYYVWRADRQKYQVTAPPDEAEVSTQANDDIFIYPKNGQSEAQQSTDRYECHQWAAGQTGFDPTQQGGGVTPGQSANKRADYLRAMKACLEGRGYSVK